MTDNLLYFVQPSYNGSLESFKRFFLKKTSCVYIRFFIYDWTLTDITLIHSQCIHNDSSIRITVVIYNSMQVASTRSWHDHSFYHGLVRNKWFSVCILIQIFFHEPFFVEESSLQHLDWKTSLFLHLLHGQLIPPPLIFIWLNVMYVIKPWNPLH